MAREMAREVADIFKTALVSLYGASIHCPDEFRAFLQASFKREIAQRKEGLSLTIPEEAANTLGILMQEYNLSESSFLSETLRYTNTELIVKVFECIHQVLSDPDNTKSVLERKIIEAITLKPNIESIEQQQQTLLNQTNEYWVTFLNTYLKILPQKWLEYLNPQRISTLLRQAASVIVTRQGKNKLTSEQAEKEWIALNEHHEKLLSFYTEITETVESDEHAQQTQPSKIKAQEIQDKFKKPKTYKLNLDNIDDFVKTATSFINCFSEITGNYFHPCPDPYRRSTMNEEATKALTTLLDSKGMPPEKIRQLIQELKASYTSLYYSWDELLITQRALESDQEALRDYQRIKIDFLETPYNFVEFSEAFIKLENLTAKQAMLKALEPHHNTLDVFNFDRYIKTIELCYQDHPRGWTLMNTLLYQYPEFSSLIQKFERIILAFLNGWLGKVSEKSLANSLPTYYLEYANVISIWEKQILYNEKLKSVIKFYLKQQDFCLSDLLSYLNDDKQSNLLEYFPKEIQETTKSLQKIYQKNPTLVEKIMLFLGYQKKACYRQQMRKQAVLRAVQRSTLFTLADSTVTSAETADPRPATTPTPPPTATP